VLGSTRGLAPTEAGWRFYERARRAIEDAQEAELVARGAGTGLSGRLRLSAAVTFVRLHVIHTAVAAVLAEHPAPDLDIILDDGDIDLIEAGIDVALRMGELADSQLTARKIWETQRLVVATLAYWESAGVPQTPDDLAMQQAVI
jgi:DNA-binding transcriptional LysR family regulator